MHRRAAFIILLVLSAPTRAFAIDPLDRYEEACGKLVFDPSRRTTELVAECSKASKPTCSITRRTLERKKAVIQDLVCVGPAALPEPQSTRSGNQYEDACYDLVMKPLKGHPHYALCSKASRSTCRIAQKRVREKGGSIAGLECIGPGN